YDKEGNGKKVLLQRKLNSILALVILTCATLFQPMAAFAAETPVQTPSEDATIVEHEQVEVEDVTEFEEGTEDPVIEQFKKDLQKLGFGTAWEEITAVYDTDMKDVVEQFQIYYNLPVNGKLDVDTQKMLEKLVTESLQIDEEHDDVYTFKKQLLSVMNVDMPSTMTNVFDTEMEMLVKDFQKEYDLVVNGLLDTVTIKKLTEVYEESLLTETEENLTEEAVEEDKSEEPQEEAATENVEEVTEEVVEDEVAEEVQEEEAINGEEAEKTQKEATPAVVTIQPGMAAAPMAKSVTYYAKGMRSADVKKMKQNLRSEEHTSELQSRFDLVCRL